MYFCITTNVACNARVLVEPGVPAMPCSGVSLLTLWPAECARRAWEHSTNGLGRSVTCDQFGGFHHTQCEGSTCYCVDTTTGKPSGSPTVHVSQVSALRCGGDADIVGGDTPCWDARRRREQQQQQSQHPLLGLEMPDCDLSGHHQPKQCSGSQCYCVDPAGRKLQPYTADRWQADDMLCGGLTPSPLQNQCSSRLQTTLLGNIGNNHVRVSKIHETFRHVPDSEFSLFNH